MTQVVTQQYRPRPTPARAFDKRRGRRVVRSGQKVEARRGPWAPPVSFVAATEPREREPEGEAGPVDKKEDGRAGALPSSFF